MNLFYETGNFARQKCCSINNSRWKKDFEQMHLAKIYSETKMKCGGCFALFVLMLAEFLNLNWSES